MLLLWSRLNSWPPKMGRRSWPLPLPSFFLRASAASAACSLAMASSVTCCVDLPTCGFPKLDRKLDQKSHVRFGPRRGDMLLEVLHAATDLAHLLQVEL